MYFPGAKMTVVFLLDFCMLPLMSHGIACLGRTLLAHGSWSFFLRIGSDHGMP